jgi:glycosyltransferase involved in cell wall biosynthesis
METPLGPGSPADTPSSPSKEVLRIALFTGNYNCITDGVSRTLHRLVSHLEGRGHQVLVFGPRPRKAGIACPGNFVPLRAVSIPGRREYRFSLGLSRAAQARVEKFSPHLLHIATPDWLGYGALRYGARLGLPVVSSFHTHFSSYLVYYRALWLEPIAWSYLRRFYSTCRQVYVPSLSMLETLRAQGFGANLHLWERGVDGEVFHPRHRSLTWRRSLGVEDSEVLMLFVSRLVKEKGLGTLAEVIHELHRRGVPLRTLVVGEGPERKRLEAQLPETIFAGHLEGEALSRAYASSDLFVFPSVTETFGNVTLEALASGLPAVCVTASGSSTIIEEGVQGFLAPRGGIADRLALLAGDRALRLAMGKAARARAETFSWERAMNRIEELYREALESPQAV